MSTLIVTLLVAFFATVCAITLLAIGWLLSGRSRVVRGACGMNPKKSRDTSCGSNASCSLCEREKIEKEKGDAANPKGSL